MLIDLFFYFLLGVIGIGIFWMLIICTYFGWIKLKNISQKNKFYNNKTGKPLSKEEIFFKEMDDHLKKRMCD